MAHIRDAVNPSREKRGQQPRIPHNYETLLTDEQRHRVEACKNFGWVLQFIRRPLFLPPTVIMIDANDTETWEITEEGALAPFNDIRH